ncbi:MAG TPA: thioredoxin TrxA [Candidatus Acidoferrum sp.]|nr:thioredoxin TrxA [Candidatus Acidoferrum sp.]
MSNEHVHHTSDANFDQDVLKASGHVLVDFWATWCGPCKMIAPVLDELAEEYAGKLKVCKMDVDANPGTAPKYNVKGIPTLILFKNGEVVGKKIGAMSKSQLAAFIDMQIGSAVAAS